MIAQDSIDDFVSAWKESDGDSFSQRMARKSLIALARREPELEPVLAQLEGGNQQHLDIRLQGRKVDDHWAPAEILGGMFQDLADAIKELAKGIAGKDRWSSRLMAFAPVGGSVKLSFATDSASRQLTLDEQNLGTPDDQALVQLGQLFAAAASESASLAGAAQSMRNNAAIPIRRVTQVLVDQEWCAEFRMYGPLHSPVQFSLRPELSKELLEVLKVDQVQIQPVTIRGILDGWKWSDGSLYLIPDHGPRFTAAVPVGLQHDVARLASVKDISIEAQFNRVEVSNIHQRRAKRTSYELLSINEVSKPVES